MKASDWISVKDELPEVDAMVLVCTSNGKFGISSMWIPTDCYGKVLVKTDNVNILMGRYQLTHPNKWYVYGFGQSQMPKVTHWREIIK